jgi:hypothetical protein
MSLVNNPVFQLICENATLFSSSFLECIEEFTYSQNYTFVHFQDEKIFALFSDDQYDAILRSYAPNIKTEYTNGKLRVSVMKTNENNQNMIRLLNKYDTKSDQKTREEITKYIDIILKYAPDKTSDMRISSLYFTDVQKAALTIKKSGMFQPTFCSDKDTKTITEIVYDTFFKLLETGIAGRYIAQITPECRILVNE